MPSVILEKLKESKDGIQMTVEEGSWFGKYLMITLQSERDICKKRKLLSPL